MSQEDEQGLVDALRGRAGKLLPSDPGVYGGDADVPAAWVRWAAAVGERPRGASGAAGDSTTSIERGGVGAGGEASRAGHPGRQPVLFACDLDPAEVRKSTQLSSREFDVWEAQHWGDPEPEEQDEQG